MGVEGYAVRRARARGRRPRAGVWMPWISRMFCGSVGEEDENGAGFEDGGSR